MYKFKWFWFLFPIISFFAVEGDPPSGEPATPPANEGGEGDKPTLTQADVDKVIASAKRGAKQQGIKEVLAELGVENLDALKQSLTDAQAAKEAQMSDLEKAQAQAEALKTERDQALEQAKTMQAEAIQTLLNSAIITASQSFNDPNDALQFINRSGIERNEDGSFSGVDEAIKALAESKPYLLKAAEPDKPKGTPSRKPVTSPNGQPPNQGGLSNAWENAKSTIRF